MHWYWLVDLQQVPTGLLVEPLDWLLELLERAKWVSIMLIFIKFWFHDDDIFVFTRKKYDTEVYYFLNQDFVNLHNFFLPISTCCCWTWICWWPIWAATKYCWLYDIFFQKILWKLLIISPFLCHTISEWFSVTRMFGSKSQIRCRKSHPKWP